MIDYFKAAEEELRRLPKLRAALEILGKRLDIEQSREQEHKGYSDGKQISERIASKIGKAEIEREIKRTEKEIECIEMALGLIDDERRRVLVWAYVDGLSGEKIAEKIYCQSAKTVYAVRNKGVEEFALLFYGAQR